jgi:ferritin-like metal-binding protein YciE
MLVTQNTVTPAHAPVGFCPSPGALLNFRGPPSRRPLDPKENGMAKLSSLDDLLVHELQDIYHAEGQILKALPKMAKAATNPDLKAAFEEHRAQTEGQVRRLEQVFKLLGQPVKGKKCDGMAGLIEEGKKILEEDADPEVLNAALIMAAQKVEHYEIAAYGCVCTYAEMLGYDEAHELLGQNLDEEEATDERLTALAESVINVEAEEGTEEETSR